MPFINRVLNRWREPVLAREFDDELRFHFESRVDANLRRGMSRDEAEIEARRHLSLGIGASAAMFSLLNAALFSRCPFRTRAASSP